MKCRVCKGPAVIDVRRHNAAFCRDHFLHHCDEQVRRAIHSHHMLEPGERVLVAVSGGKDSLALWEILVRLGYEADGLYLGLGIGDYSDRIGRLHHGSSPRTSGVRCIEVDLAADYGYTIPEAASATRRAPCGACGLSKRHLFNSVAIEHGYDVVATGHNLDDEAAVLLGNVLRWDTGYLGRQHPVLPASPGFVRKVKPLVRLGRAGDRPPTACCGASTTRSRSARWPRATGTSATRRCSTRSRTARPASKAAFLFGFLERGHERFADDAAHERDELGACTVCGAPTPGEGVRVLPAARAGRRDHARPRRSSEGQADVARPFAAGERVLLVDAKRRRHLVTLAAGGEFHTHAGVLAARRRHRSARRRHRAHHPRRAARSRCARRWPSTCSRCRAARR